MTSRIDHTTFDCHDAYALSTFWSEVLGFTDVPGDPNEPGDEECMIIDPAGGQQVLFIEVPEDKQVKNRVHFDWCPQIGPATRRSSGSALWGLRPSMIGVRPMARGGSCSPIPRATSSASCEATGNASLGALSPPRRREGPSSSALGCVTTSAYLQ